MAGKQAREKQLLALGTPVIDHFCKVEQSFVEQHGLAKGSSNFVGRPEFDQYLEALGKKMVQTCPGDNTRNTIESFARMLKANRNAEEAAGYAGMVGSDANAQIVEKSLTENGIISLLRRTEGRTGEILCLVTPDAERTFIVENGVSEDYGEELDCTGWKNLYLTSITLLTSNSVSKAAKRLMDEFLKESERGLFFFSLESPEMLSRNKEKAMDIFKKADVVFANEQELRAIGFEESRLPGNHCLLFLKKGDKGSSVYKKGRLLGHVGAFGISNLLDTTGAGDNFGAGAMHALLHGKEPLAAARQGNLLGSLCVQKFGAALPPDLEKRLEQ